MMMTEKHCKLQRCYTQATCLATLQKVEDSSTSLATRNATIAVAKWGVTCQVFLATCNATFVALQVERKILPRVTWPLRLTVVPRSNAGQATTTTTSTTTTAQVLTLVGHYFNISINTNAFLRYSKAH